MRKIELRRRVDGWSVRARNGDGSGVEYRFDSKNQARFFAAVMRMGPRNLPGNGRPLQVRAEAGEERF